ncbi:MAG: tetratricopeptide repeat protein, partial [Oscillospiraceae bacterium]|nr:tetratricopeptide repeat protein [Oscillospiraceae bacterium]
MIENKTKKGAWPVLLRVLAVVLVAALLLSLIMPAVSGFLSQTGEDEQSFIDDFDRFNTLADLAITEEKYGEAAGFLEKALELAEGKDDEELAKLCLKLASVYVICGDKENAKALLDRTLELNESSF